VSWRSRVYFELLKTLIEAQGSVVSYLELETKVWSRPQTRHHICETVRIIKNKLEICSDYIKNQPGEGYYWDPPSDLPVLDANSELELRVSRLRTIARQDWMRRTRSSVRRALDRFRELAELQPNAADAHLGIAECLLLLAHIGFQVFDTRATLPVMRREARHALKLAVLAQDKFMQSRALTAIAHIEMIFDWNWRKAERGLDSAIAVNPKHPTAYQLRAHLFLATMRWPEALDAISKAASLAVESPMIHGTSGWLHYFMGNYQEAVAVNKETTRLFAEFPPGYTMLGLAHEAEESFEKAIEAFQAAFELDATPVPLAAMAHAYAVWGKKTQAQRTLKRLERLAETEIVSPYFFALVHVGLGNAEKALLLLECAKKEKCDWLTHLNVDPRWRPLYERTHYSRLLKSVGLPSPKLGTSG
jgi:tetratricopeptide (TPR) repeat protein